MVRPHPVVLYQLLAILVVQFDLEVLVYLVLLVDHLALEDQLDLGYLVGLQEVVGNSRIFVVEVAEVLVVNSMMVHMQAHNNLGIQKDKLMVSLVSCSLNL